MHILKHNKNSERNVANYYLSSKLTVFVSHFFTENIICRNPTFFLSVNLKRNSIPTGRKNILSWMAVLLLQIIKINVLREGIFTKFRYYETKLSETFRLQLLLSSCQFIDTDAIFFYFPRSFPWNPFFIVKNLQSKFASKHWSEIDLAMFSIFLSPTMKFTKL